MATYKGHTHTRTSEPEPVTPSTRVNPVEVERPKYQTYNRTVGKFLGKVNDKLDNGKLGKDSAQTLLSGNLNKSWRGLIVLNRMGLNPLNYVDRYVFDKIDQGVNYLLKPGGIQQLSLNKLTAPQYTKVKINEDPKIGTDVVKDRRILVGRDINQLIGTDEAPGPLKDKLFTWFSEDGEDRSAVVEDPSGGQKNSILIFNPLIETKMGMPMYIELQNRPHEIDYHPQSTWADIKSMGRNVPV